MDKVLSGPDWIIRPEKQDLNSGKRPDLTVGKTRLNSHVQMKYVICLVMELKSYTGERFEEAVVQTVDEIADGGPQTASALWAFAWFLCKLILKYTIVSPITKPQQSLVASLVSNMCHNQCHSSH